MKKILHYTKKVIQLGPRQSLKVLQNRIKTKHKAKKLKKQALAKQAHYTWHMIVQKHNVEKPFEEFLHQLKQNCQNVFPEEILRPLEQDLDIEKKADQFAEKVFDLLGSGPIRFEQIDWHVDFRLKKQDPKSKASFCKNRFYQEPEFGESKVKQFAKDIKLPWELSRCYHFAILGQAYKKTKNKTYRDAFYAHLDDWTEKNPYLLGPNWMCPMEVGIRAINWIAGFYYFKAKKKMYVESLYDHFVHLENNWEIYDSRTSNHYLSDLVGYFFLCFFFQDLSGVEKKKQWCYREILHEFDKQVFDEGTDYEGSTAYHGLVTELFYLFYELCKKNKQPLPEGFEKRLAKMFEFIDFCTLVGKVDMVKIGDDDSGKILFSGITKKLIKKFVSTPLTGTKQFPEFGLSIIKTKNWHITLRHHAYENKQPSGHFHNDIGSITLAVDDVPILVDPGSFVYTASSVWRNKFRSVQVHNAFYVQGHEPVPFEDFLFTLALNEKRVSSYEQNFVLQTKHNLYKRFGLSAQRTISFDKEKNTATVSDVWLGQLKIAGLVSCHNFTLAPNITPVYQDGFWVFLHKQKPILSMQVDGLSFQVAPAWFAPAYGKKVKTLCLRASCPVVIGKRSGLSFAKSCHARSKLYA